MTSKTCTHIEVMHYGSLKLNHRWLVNHIPFGDLWLGHGFGFRLSLLIKPTSNIYLALKRNQLIPDNLKNSYHLARMAVESVSFGRPFLPLASGVIYCHISPMTQDDIFIYK